MHFSHSLLMLLAFLVTPGAIPFTALGMEPGAPLSAGEPRSPLLASSLKDADWISWEDCIQIATRNNPSVPAAQEAYDSSDALVKAAYGALMPQLTFQAGANYGVYLSPIGALGASGGNASGGATAATGAEVFSSANQQYSAGIRATQLLFDGLNSLGQIQNAYATRNYNQAAVDLAKVSLSYNLRTGAANLAYHQHNFEQSTDILTRQKKNTESVERLFKLGRENLGNLLYQKALVSQYENQVAHEERQIISWSEQLAAIMGIPKRGNLRLKDDPPDPPQALLEKKPDYEAIALDHPQRREALFQVMEQRAQVRIANSAWFPQISATGLVEKIGSTIQMPSLFWSVGLVISYPFFPGDSTIYKVKSSYAVLEQYELQLRQTENQIIQGLASAYMALKDAAGLLKVARDYVTGAQARTLIARKKYQVGLMTFENWTIIEADLATRILYEISARNTVQLTLATWEKATGTGTLR